LKGTVIEKFEKDGRDSAKVRTIPSPGDVFRESFALINCISRVEIGDLVAFDAMLVDIVGNQEVLLATSAVVLKRADGSVPSFLA
jgi:hypothetical protein